MAHRFSGILMSMFFQEHSTLHHHIVYSKLLQNYIHV
nr:MAG TPA: hypothetical protein [Bacteriophage sp.]